MRLVRSGFLVATTGLSLVATTLGGATAARAATPCSVAATTGATFYGCWGDSNPDLVITMGANLTLSSRVLSSGAKRTIDLAGFNVIFGGGIQVSATDTLVIEDSAGTGTMTAGPSNDGAGIGGNADACVGRNRRNDHRQQWKRGG